jgi:hypothetical protein
MDINGWFLNHDGIDFTITHPKTKAGHKTDIEMYSLSSNAKSFRESITYAKITEERIVELLDDMYYDIKRQERSFDESNN